MGILTMGNADEIARMRRKGEAITAKLAGTVRPTLLDAAQRIVALMKQLTPVYSSEAHGDPPGSLRDSIVATPDDANDSSVKITAGNDQVRYAKHVEFGTAKMAAEPFFYPVIRILKARTKAQIKRAFTAAVRDEMARR
jgi:HK97 gp10 family phage protein